MKIDLEMIEDAEGELENMKTQYLNQHGWEYSCANPASLWLWEKVIRGVQYRGLTKDLALHLERNL